MSAQLNVEDHINVGADHEDTFLRDLLEKKKFNDVRFFWLTIHFFTFSFFL